MGGSEFQAKQRRGLEGLDGSGGGTGVKRKITRKQKKQNGDYECDSVRSNLHHTSMHKYKTGAGAQLTNTRTTNEQNAEEKRRERGWCADGDVEVE